MAEKHEYSNQIVCTPVDISCVISDTAHTHTYKLTYTQDVYTVYVPERGRQRATK